VRKEVGDPHAICRAEGVADTRCRSEQKSSGKILSTHVFRTSKVDEDAMEEFLFVGSGEGFGHRCAANPEHPNRENILAEGIRPDSKGALLGRRWTSIRFIRWRQTSGTNLTEISKPNVLCCGGVQECFRGDLSAVSMQLGLDLNSQSDWDTLLCFWMRIGEVRNVASLL
jgi:hypothetical protein